MFALFETRVTAPDRWMERLFRRKREGYTIERSEAPRFLRAALDWPLNTGEQERRRRAKRVFTELCGHQAVGLVLPARYPWPEDVPPGLLVCGPEPLYRRLGWRAVFRALERREGGKLTVALLARRSSSLLTEAVRQIKSRNVTLSVWAGSDTEAFCYGLRKYEGMALLAQEHPTADLYLLLEPPHTELRVPDSSLVLNFSGAHPVIRGGIHANAMELEPPLRWHRAWPWGCDTPAMLLAMYHSGQLALSDIRLGALLCNGRPVQW